MGGVAERFYNHAFKLESRMKKINPLACITFLLGLVSLYFGMLAFQRMSDFFLRHYVLKMADSYHNTLHAYMVCVTRDSWAIRDYLTRYVAPSVIGFTIAALTWFGMKQPRSSASRCSLTSTAIRFPLLGFYLNAFNVSALAVLYILAYFRKI